MGARHVVAARDPSRRVIEPQHAYNAGALAADVLHQWSGSQLREAAPIGDTFVSSIVGLWGDREVLTLFVEADGSGHATINTGSPTEGEARWEFLYDARQAIATLTADHEPF